MTIEERKNINTNIIQNLILENRHKLSISGVMDVLSFDDQIVILETDLGMLTVKGDNLKINKLSIDTADVIIEGEINTLSYSQKDLERRNEGIFSKIFKNRFNNRRIKIGWAGNSAWHLEEEDFKGVNTILKPVIQELLEENYPVEIKYADKATNMIPYDEMINFYNDIDIFICTSKYEGTPCTVLEAIACKNVIISTDVGIVKEVLGQEQQEFILEERTKRCLKQKIIKLIENRNLFEKLSNENLERVKEWDVKVVYQRIKEFYDYIVNNCNDDTVTELYQYIWKACNIYKKPH